tara:strand:+ start:603 stop:902 length:300 start_codon:yes stop_codon:yes gene_type:complete
VSEKYKGAKSYRGELVDGDTFRLNVNLRFLFNCFILFSTIIGSAYHIKSEIDSAIRRLSELEERVDSLQEIHDEEMKEIVEELKWYQKNINPFAKRKKK